MDMEQVSSAAAFVSREPAWAVGRISDRDDLTASTPACSARGGALASRYAHVACPVGASAASRTGEEDIEHQPHRGCPVPGAWGWLCEIMAVAYNLRVVLGFESSAIPIPS
jgi:hypothetical protein